jgi:hypothetical protein
MFTSDWTRELKTFLYKVRTARSILYTLDTTKALNSEKVGLRKAIVRFWLRTMQGSFRGVLEAVRTGIAPGSDEERWGSCINEGRQEIQEHFNRIKRYATPEMEEVIKDVLQKYKNFRQYDPKKWMKLSTKRLKGLIALCHPEQEDDDLLPFNMAQHSLQGRFVDTLPALPEVTMETINPSDIGYGNLSASGWETSQLSQTTKSTAMT